MMFQGNNGLGKGHFCMGVSNVTRERPAALLGLPPAGPDVVRVQLKVSSMWDRSN
jgi:hypothetical protein